MIPATYPHIALIENKIDSKSDATYIAKVPVIAWGEDGDALIVDEKGGCLRIASNFKGFIRVEADHSRAMNVRSFDIERVNQEGTA